MIGTCSGHGTSADSSGGGKCCRLRQQLSAIWWLDGEKQRRLTAAAEGGFKSEVRALRVPPIVAAEEVPDDSEPMGLVSYAKRGSGDSFDSWLRASTPCNRSCFCPDMKQQKSTFD